MNDENNLSDHLETSGLLSGLEGLSRTISRLNADLQRTTDIMDLLNDRLSHLTLAQAVVPELRIAQYESGENDEDKIKETGHSRKDAPQTGPTSKKGEHDKNDFIESIKSVHKLAESSKKVAEVFEELSPKIKTAKNVLGSIGELTEGISGIGELFSAAEGTITATEGISAAAEIMTGAAGVAEIGAALGPPGWIAAIGALAIGGVAAVVMSDSKDDKSSYMDMNPANWEKFFMQQERQKDYEKLVDVYDVSNFKQLRDVKKELDEDYLVADRKQRVAKLMSEWQKSTEEIQRNSPVSFPELKNKWVKHDQRQSDEYLRTLFPFLPAPPTHAEKLSREIEEVNKRYAFDDAFRLAGDKTSRKKDPKREKQRQNEIDALKKKYRPEKPFSLLQNQEPKWRLPTEQEWESHVDKERRKARGLPERPTARASAAHTKSHREREMATTGYSLLGTSANTGRVININLNKPMIEHFTINAREVKEGINDFKRKVEEVLLEILNSANAIQ